MNTEWTPPCANISHSFGFLCQFVWVGNPNSAALEAVVLVCPWGIWFIHTSCIPACAIRVPSCHLTRITIVLLKTFPGLGMWLNWQSASLACRRPWVLAPVPHQTRRGGVPLYLQHPRAWEQGDQKVTVILGCRVSSSLHYIKPGLKNNSNNSFSFLFHLKLGSNLEATLT